MCLTDKADKALENTAYSVEVRVKYDSDDEEMLDAIKSFSNPSMRIYVDGDKFRGTMDLKHNGVKNYITYTFVDGVLYTEFNENGNTVQNKQTMGDSDKAALKESFGAGANVGTEDFENLSVQSLGKVSVIRCDTIKDDALIALVNSLKAEFAAAKLTADVALKNATLDIEIDGGKYNVVILTCEYYIITPVDSYSIKMTHSSKFTYDDDFEIVAPAFD